MRTRDVSHATFYTTEQLGPNRARTPEGFLACNAVPIARAGEMIYGPGETPIPEGDDGRVIITRTAEEVFKPESILSIVGKPVTDEHPPVDVQPDNWRYYTKGVVINPRRGDGRERDLLLADLLIFDPELIDDIEAGKREVSCGYNPEYVDAQDEDGELIRGRGFQRDIYYNHLALVERGRCGPRCSIGDQRTVDGRTEKPMARKNGFKNALLKLRGAFSAKDQRAFDEALEEVEEVAEDNTDPDLVIHNHIPGAEDEPAENEEMARRIREQQGGAKSDDEGGGVPPWFAQHKTESDDRFRSLHDAFRSLHDQVGEALKKWAEQEGTEPEHSDDTHNDGTRADDVEGTEKAAPEKNKNILGELEFEAPPGTGDKARAAKDSTYLNDSFQDVVAKAEVLAPGLSLPSFNVKAAPMVSFRAIDGLRRTALDLAYNKPESRGIIDSAMSGRPFEVRRMRAADVRTLFNAVASMQREFNNRRSTDNNGLSVVSATGQQLTNGRIKSIADMNRLNRERRLGRRSA